MSKFLDQNGLLYFWQKIVNKFVAKEAGKGLSANDYTTEDKTKLGGLANVKRIGSGLELDPDSGTLNATQGGTADSVDWSGVQNKPTTLAGYGITDAASANHKHDDTYLKLSGGTMTGPILFSDDQGQIGVDAETAAAKIEMDNTAAEIIFTDKQNAKTNRMTVSATGAVIAVGETTPGDGTGTQITVDETNGVKIPKLADPVDTRDAVHKAYVDAKVNAKANSADVYKKTETYSKAEIDGKGFLVDSDIAGKADKANTLAGYGITDAYTKTDVYNKAEVDGKLSSVYKPAGEIAFAELPTPNASNLGNVYSIKEAFTTDDRFITSAPTPYPIGTNVVVILVQGKYYFDILAGFVDLSGYLKTTDMVAITNQEIDAIVA